MITSYLLGRRYASASPPTEDRRGHLWLIVRPGPDAEPPVPHALQRLREVRPGQAARRRSHQASVEARLLTTLKVTTIVVLALALLGFGVVAVAYTRTNLPDPKRRS